MTQHKAPKKCSSCGKDKHRVIKCSACYRIEREQMEVMRDLLQEWLNAGNDENMKDGVCIKDWGEFENRVEAAIEKRA